MNAPKTHEEFFSLINDKKNWLNFLQVIIFARRTQNVKTKIAKSHIRMFWLSEIIQPSSTNAIAIVILDIGQQIVIFLNTNHARPSYPQLRF